MNNVRVTCHPNTGKVINSSENADWGYVRVEQERAMFDDVTGFMKVKKISALVHGLVKDLEKLGWRDQQLIGGNIIFREQTLPFRKGREADKDVKVAGDTGVICSVKGSPIYRQTFYSSNPNAIDIPVPHDNGEEIRIAFNSMGAEKQDDKIEDFSL